MQVLPQGVCEPCDLPEGPILLVPACERVNCVSSVFAIRQACPMSPGGRFS